ncbi:response regulator transcription factor, partial [bacterium]
MQAEKISVLLVDDHNMVRMGLHAYFDTLADIEVVGEAATGEEAVRLVVERTPDVVLMDLLMPGMDGVEATRQIKKVSPSTQVIVLTSYHEDEHIFPAIRAGALSYVLKDIDPDNLAETVRRARAGEAVLNPRVAARMVQEIHGARSQGVNPFQELTDRE